MGWRDPLSTPNLTRLLPRALCAAVLLAIAALAWGLLWASAERMLAMGREIRAHLREPVSSDLRDLYDEHGLPR